MVKFNYFFVKSIKDVLSYETIKLALITAIPISIMWIGLGWLLWDEAVSVIYKAIAWIPFSIIRANGAFIIAFFIWILVTMVTYSFIVALFSNFFYKRIESRFYEFLNVILVLFISVFWSLVIILKWENLYDIIKKLLTLLPFETVDQGVSYLLTLYLFYNFFVITLYAIVYIFKEPYLTTLKEIHYQDVKDIDRISVRNSYIVLFRDILLFIVFTLVAIPLLFIPFANILTIWFLWAWLYKDSAFVGICSLFCNNEELNEAKHHRIVIWIITVTASLLNFIPLISFFTPFFVLTMYFHWIMHFKKLNIREARGF